MQALESVANVPAKNVFGLSLHKRLEDLFPVVNDE